MQLAPTDAAWLAGYIDGDGCICLSRKDAGRRRAIVLVIDSADIEILEHVQKLVGGSMVMKTKAKEHHRQARSWRLYGALRVISLLKQLLPYMRCAFKATRARMLIEEWEECTPRNGFYTPEIEAKKADFERRFFAIGAGRGRRTTMEEQPGGSPAPL